MADLISREAATRAAVISVRDYLGNIDSERDIHIEEGLYEVPAVEAVPVVHARWLYKERHRKSYRQYTGFDDMGDVHTITVMEESEGKEPYCSECGAQAAESFMNYCPKCGAKMIGDDNG